MEAEETMDCLQEFPEHHKMILDRLNEQREQDRFTDITLIVDGGWGGGLWFGASVLTSLYPAPRSSLSESAESARWAPGRLSVRLTWTRGL